MFSNIESGEPNVMAFRHLSERMRVAHTSHVVAVLIVGLFGASFAPTTFGKGKPPKPGGGENDAENPLEVTIDTSDSYGVFDDDSGVYKDSDQGTFAGLSDAGELRLATTGPGVADSGANRTLEVTLLIGTQFDSGPFDLRVAPAEGVNPRDLAIGDSTCVNAQFIANDFEGGTSKNRMLYYGAPPSAAAPSTGGPLVITRTTNNEWVLEADPGSSKARIVELVKDKGKFSWEPLHVIDNGDPNGAGYLPFSATIVEVNAAP